MGRCIDLNCDVGESFGAYTIGSDAEILRHVTSANIACGFHAGDPATMRRTVRLAVENKVAIGAHPGLPDLVGFGRREMQVSAQEVYELVLYQVGALAAFARGAGTAVSHIKPHGALYNIATKDGGIAQAIAQATRDFDPTCVLVGQSGSQLIEAGRAAGLNTASEAFGDRTYQADGSLTPRHLPNALISDPSIAAERVMRMVLEGKIESQQGTDVPISTDTICIHGDSPGAADLAKAIRARLEQHGIKVRSFSTRGTAVT